MTVILLVGGILVLFDPNKIKPLIITEVKKRSGYDINIDSQLGWSFYPTFSISIPHLTLTAKNETHPFLELQNVKLATQVKSLWEDRKQLQGDVYADAMTLGNLHAQRVTAKLAWQNRVLTISPITANLYEGSLQGVVSGTQFDAIPNWHWQLKTADISMLPLLADLNANQGSFKISGKTNLQCQGTANGKDQQTFLQSMQANLQTIITNGKLQGIDLNYLIQNADAILNKKPITSVDTGETNFETIVGNGMIAGGILTNQNLVLTSNAFTAEAKGNINLIAKTINMQLAIHPKDDKDRFTIPGLITGELSHPHIGLDMDEIGKMLARKELEKVKERVKEEINNRLPGASDFLQKLLGK